MNPVPRERSTSFFASLFGSKKDKEPKESKIKKSDKSKSNASPTSPVNSPPTSPKKSSPINKDDKKNKVPKSPQKLQAFMRDSSSNDESAPSSPSSSSSIYQNQRNQVKEINIKDVLDDRLIQLAQDCELDCLITLVEERSECAEFVQRFLEGLSKSDEEFLITQNSWLALADLCNRFDEDEVVLEHTTMALATIAQDFGQHNNIVHHIKFPKLIELSNTDKIETQLNVITLVAYLALNDDHHYNVTQYLLETLIFLGFTAQNMKLKIAVANTISNLALNEQDAVYICKEGGMELLQAWLSIDKHITVDKNIILLLKATLSAITNLTLATEKLKYQVIQKIGWRKISTYLQIQPVDDEEMNNNLPARDNPQYLVNQILCSVTLAIANLATLDDQSESISSLNIVYLLKKCLLSKLSNVLYNLDVIQGCVLALNSISAYEELQDQMIFDGLVETQLDVKRKLIEVTKNQANELTDRSQSVIQNVMDLILATLKNLNAESFFTNSDTKIDYQTISKNGNRGQVPTPEVNGQRGPVAELIESIKKCIKSSLETGSSSSSFKDYNKIMPRTSSNTSLTSNDSYGSYASVNITIENVQFVVGQLKNIAKLPAGNQITAASQTPNLLGNLVSIIPSPQLDRPCQEKIIDLILAICHDNRFEDTRLDNASVQELLNLMNHGSIGPKAASLIAALSAYNKNLTRIMRSSGAIVRLVYLLNQNNMTTKSNALYALHALCNDAESQENVFQLGGLDSILKLIDLNLSDNMKCIVCLALKSIVTSNSIVIRMIILTFTEKMQDHVRRNYPSALETVIQFLMSADSDVKSNTCRLILEVARNNEKNQSFLCKAGAPQLLISTLVLLTVTEKNRKEFVKGGAIDALEALNHVPSSKVQTATKQTLALFKKS